MTDEDRVQHVSWLLPTLALVATAATVANILEPGAFTAKGPNLQLAVNTAISVVAVIAATLLFGRFRESHSLGDLLLVVAFLLILVANFCLASLPRVIEGAAIDRFSAWGSDLGRFSAYVLLAAAAFCPPRRITFARRAMLITAASSVALLAVIAGAIALLGPSSPPLQVIDNPSGASVG